MASTPFESMWSDRRISAAMYSPLEEARSWFGNSLGKVFHHIGKNEFNPNDKVLAAGIGTGQIEEHINFNTHIVGIDINPHFLSVAQQRNQNALLVEGDLRKTLPFADNTFGGVLICDTADCLDPNEHLPTLLKETRRVAKKIVLIKTNTPNDEFFGSTLLKKTEGGPGIEGLPRNSKAAIIKDLEERGINAKVTNPLLLLQQLQTLVEKQFGDNFRLEMSFEEALTRIGADIDSIARNIMGQERIRREFATRDYPAQVLGFIAILEQNILSARDQHTQRIDPYIQRYNFDTFRQTYERQYRKSQIAMMDAQLPLPLSQNELLQHINFLNSISMTYRLFQLATGVLMQTYYDVVIDQELIKAGYSRVEHKTAATQDGKVVSPRVVGNLLNTSLALTRTGCNDIGFLPDLTSDPESGLNISGVPMTLRYPYKQPYFKGVFIRYITAE